MINRGGVFLLGTGAAVGIVLAMLFGNFFRQPPPAPIIINTPAATPTILPTITPGPTATAQPIQVFVNGAVNAPDVYILPPDSRVKQGVEAAGGFREDANTAVVNLAMPLVDGMHIYIPDVHETVEAPPQVIANPTVQSRSAPVRLAGDTLININTADLEELDRLPGIGPAIAQRIIDYRAANGAFPTVEAILEVSGIGEVTFEEIREMITTGN